jgi:O-antigen/teichoic acid export membrane protein
MFYEPSASRVWARGDTHGLENLYWKSAAWVAVLTFPLFALSFTAAEPMTVLLFGERYSSAAPILSLIAVGTYLDAAAGFNDSTLRVSGKVRWLMAVNAFSAFLNITLNILLIPRMGALGAGIATGTAMFIYAVLKKICLWRATGVRVVHPAYLGTYLAIGSVTIGLALLRILWANELWILLPCMSAGIAVVALQARATLSITETFPELARWPLLKRLLR